MATGRVVGRDTAGVSEQNPWVKTGFKAALFSIVAVVAVQALALAIWPELAAFKPLDGYPRTDLFVLIPALGATGVFAWLVKHQDQPVKKFFILSVVVLLLSVMPDYTLPLENKTLLGSTVAAFMHLVAGVVTVGTLVLSHSRQADM